MRHAPVGDVRRREEDVPQGLPGRSPRQTDGHGQRGTIKGHLHGAQRRMVKVPRGRGLKGGIR